MKDITVHISSESPLKHRAISNALRRVGYEAKCIGYATETGVNEQPMSVAETLEGARNRHKSLKKVVGDVACDVLLVSYESGYAPKNEVEGIFGFESAIITFGSQELVSTDYGTHFPDEMLANVPEKYPDLGVLVQQKYGAKEKDPVPYITNGVMSRTEFVERAVLLGLIRLKDFYGPQSA